MRPSRIKNITRVRYFVLFINNHSRITWVYLMREKFEVGKIFWKFNNIIQSQFHTRIQILRTNDAKKYFKLTLGSYLENQGITHHSMCWYTLTKWNMKGRIVIFLRWPDYLFLQPVYQTIFGGEAIVTAIYFINRVTSQVLKFMTAIQKFLTNYPHNRTISLIPQKIFGCIGFVHIDSQQRGKLDPRSVKCIFFG